MKIFRHVISCKNIISGLLLLAATIGFGGAAAQTAGVTPTRKPTWEILMVNDATAASVEQPTPQIGVTVRDGGVVLISSDCAVCVQVYSILGQLITQKQMQAGTVRLTLDARGIFILKADNVTRRISL